MTFRKEKEDEFLNLFNSVKSSIRSFPGVEALHLYRDRSDSRIFFTYSIWDKSSSLEKYRRSDLFRNIWQQTRAMFETKADAWSVDKITDI
jgi:heme-degrading monooxygenase HmoA